MIRRVAAPALAAFTLATTTAMPLTAVAAPDPQRVEAIAERRLQTVENICMYVGNSLPCLEGFVLIEQAVENFVNRFTF